ncbi:MAG: hypothetical protein PHU06_06425 [Gallionella sp.]|nr:hypothetical protein [Gallionella sp.]MDD4958147.1 hypothetical protein [Gallionella sp.]
MIEPKPVSEFWLNPGFYSYHFQQNKRLNNENFGLGGEYRYSTVSSFTLGAFRNSDKLNSRYLGWYWQPIEVGVLRLGAGIGLMDNYTHMRNGNLFLAVIPTISFEYQNMGANIIVIPSYKDRIYGSISLQLKLKL